MSLIEAMLQAGLVPKPPKHDEEKKARNDESSRALRFLNDFKKRKSAKKRNQKDEAEKAGKKSELGNWIAAQHERAAQASAATAQSEFAAARRARMPSASPDE